MPTAWRLVKTKYVASAFDGEGARLNGGRWSSPGVRVVYVSETLSLALLEVLVHLRNSAVLSAYSAFQVDYDDLSVTQIDFEDLPANWRTHPPPPENQILGDRWVEENKSALLRVPSVVVPNEFNYLLNPTHPDFPLIQIGSPMPFPFDDRLVLR